MYKQLLFQIRFKGTLMLYFVYVLNFATFVSLFCAESIF